MPAEVLKKPDWIRVKAGSPTTRFYEIKQILREHKLHTVCEEASCPNIGECFGHGTATFMIMGRQVHGAARSATWATAGPIRSMQRAENLAKTIAALKLKYVVITSVDRDDLRDGGAATSSSASARRASCRRPRASRSSRPTSAAARPRAGSSKAARRT